MELTLEVNSFGFIILEYLQNYLKKEYCDFLFDKFKFINGSKFTV